MRKIISAKVSNWLAICTNPWGLAAAVLAWIGGPPLTEITFSDVGVMTAFDHAMTAAQHFVDNPFVRLGFWAVALMMIVKAGKSASEANSRAVKVPTLVMNDFCQRTKIRQARAAAQEIEGKIVEYDRKIAERITECPFVAFPGFHDWLENQAMHIEHRIKHVDVLLEAPDLQLASRVSPQMVGQAIQNPSHRATHEYRLDANGPYFDAHQGNVEHLRMNLTKVNNYANALEMRLDSDVEIILRNANAAQYK